MKDRIKNMSDIARTRRGYYPAGYSGTDTFENTDKFTTITDDTSFYLNSDGDPARHPAAQMLPVR